MSISIEPFEAEEHTDYCANGDYEHYTILSFFGTEIFRTENYSDTSYGGYLLRDLQEAAVEELGAFIAEKLKSRIKYSWGTFRVESKEN